MKKLLFITFLCIINISGHGILAQEISMKDCQILPNDKFAVENPRYDNNGNLCAVVKITTNNIDGLKFPNTNQYVGNISCVNDTYIIYLPETSYRIDFQHNDYLNGQINMYEEYGYKAKQGKVYSVKLEKPIVIDANTIAASFKVIPAVKATVTINGKKLQTSPNGELVIELPNGTYSYQVAAENYNNIYGQFSINNEVIPIVLHLSPTTKAINVTSNIKAKVYIDDTYCGETGIIEIPLGHHRIRIEAKGYVDYSEDINITEEVTSLNYTLDKNKGKTIEVHPVAIKVYCNTTKLYRNNRELKNWYNGKEVAFMPNKACLLSDDNDNRYRFTPREGIVSIRLNNGSISLEE